MLTFLKLKSGRALWFDLEKSDASQPLEMNCNNYANHSNIINYCTVPLYTLHTDQYGLLPCDIFC